VPDPERAVVEIARVLERPGGVAILGTPNRLTFARPDEVIDPYHYVEFDADQLHALCAPAFANVELRGLFGSARYLDIVARERRRLDALLARDPLRLRRLVPRRARQRLYDALLRRARHDPDPLAAAITPEDFTLGGAPLDACLDLVAVCRA
jgi:SAM-dependent methyltransferase